MHDGITVMAGDCTTVSRGGRDAEQRGDVVVVVKPDNTILVHDAEGYQPVDWLTRPDSISIEDGTITARDGDQLLRVVTHESHGQARYPTSTAGTPIGDCPACTGILVRASGSVSCTGCDAEYRIPSDARMTGGRCPDCRLPTMAVDRGQRFELCLDRECDPLDERVHAAFDREWDCPACDGALRIINRGHLLAGCEHYPECEVGFSLPTGVIDGQCDCGLPAFQTDSGRRCLDSTCEAV